MAGPRLNFAQVRLLGAAIKIPTAYQFPPSFGSGFAGTGFTSGSITGSDILGTMGTQGISLKIPAYLTTAMASNATFGGTGFTTASTGGSVLVGTLGTDGLSLGVPAWLTAATAGGGGTGFTSVSTAGSDIVATMGTNGLSMGIPAYLTTATGGGGAGTGFTTASTAGTDIVGTLDTNGLSMGIPAYLTAATAGGAGTGFTSASTAGSDIVATMGTNGLSMGVPAYLTTAMLSDASSVFAGTAFSTTSTTGTNLVATINTAGMAMGVPVWLTTAALSQDSSKYAGTNATMTGGSITVNTSGVSIALPAYLTTAMASDASSNFAGTAFSTTSTTGTNLVATINTAGMAMGVPAWITTAMASGASSAFAGTGFTSASTAGTDIVGTLATNGLSVGVPAYLTTYAFPRLDQVLDPTADKVFSMGSNQLQLSWATGGSFSTNATRQGFFELDVAGNLTQEADVIHLHQHGGAPTLLDLLHAEADGANVTAIRGQVGASIVAELNQPIKFTTRDTNYSIGSVPMILGTQMSNSVANLNANFVQGKASSVLAGTGFTTATTVGTAIVGTLQTNGLSMGVPAYLTTATAGAGLTNINVSAGTTSSNVSAVTFSNGSGVSFGYDGTNITATVATDYAGTGFTTTTTTATQIGGTNDHNGLKLGIPPWAPATLSYFANLPVLDTNTQSVMYDSNSGWMFPVSIPNYISASYMRFFGDVGMTSTSVATSAVNNVTGASTAISYTGRWNAVVYGIGSGTASRVLTYLTKASVGFSWGASVSQESTTNASRQSITQSIVWEQEGSGSGNVTTQYSVTSTHGPIYTSGWANLQNARFMDMPFNVLVTPGVYWIGINQQTGTVGSKSFKVTAGFNGLSQRALTIMPFNQNSIAALSHDMIYVGLAQFTIAGQETTSSIYISNMSAAGGGPLPMFQLIRQA